MPRVEKNYRSVHNGVLKPEEVEALSDKKEFRRYLAKHVEKGGGRVQIDKVDIRGDEVIAWGHCIKHPDRVAGRQHMSYKFRLYKGPVVMLNSSQSDDGLPGGGCLPVY